MKIETILLACDDSPTFLSFLPSVAYHWRSMGYRVAFGLVTSTPLSPKRDAYLRYHCDDVYVYVYSNPSRYSVIAMAKLFRFYLTKYYPAATVCVQDIDYYVFDKHAHIERRIQSPATEVLTHGYNAYYTTYGTDSRSPPLVCYAVVPGLSSQTDMVYGLDGKLHLNGIGTGRLIRKTLYIPAAIRFPATPMVAHGRRLYGIFSTDESLSFDAFLEHLDIATRGFDPALNDGNNPYTLDSPAFSDESLIYQLNRTNKVVYRHTRRDDFVDSVAGARIDPRKSPHPDSWYPLAKTHSVRDLLRAGYFMDIQPLRPLEDSLLMHEVFDALQIPRALLHLARDSFGETTVEEAYRTKFGTATDVRSLGWGSEASQTTRFRVLLEMDGFETHDSVLDVGCGYGDLSTRVHVYAGVDIRARAIEEAKRRYPALDVRVGSIEDVDDTFDWVVASGIFAFACPEWNARLVHTVEEMLKRATKGVALNVLSSRTPNAKDPEMMYADPETVLRLLTPLASRVVLRDDYLVNDMTVYLYKDSPRI